jgi:hypothetical protein
MALASFVDFFIFIFGRIEGLSLYVDIFMPHWYALNTLQA